ncbi:MAG TPA: type II toxin-antitoxin system VapC family toxin [Candidatus Saccharimonadales bacterium]|nr:type II toxin-antitoxin system VapC family toxin [Candidatus Saccharimonadales bacterium]
MNSKLLLDTNSLIWILDDRDKDSFGKNALKKVAEAEVVYTSSISILEIRIKTMLGKLHTGPDLLNDIEDTGIKILSFTEFHADGLLNFPKLIRHDPFDRMLIAQAEAESLIFLTSDKLIIDLGLPFVIDARK